jgi:hypothetical protein
MCRLAYIPDAGIELPIPMGEFFAWLENRAGGHGNGVGWFDPDTKEPHIVKSKQLTADDAAELGQTVQTQKGFIFHTRLASMGSRTDDNCHPFEYGQRITCHNGTWGKARELKWQILLSGGMPATRLLDCTDSEIMAFLIGKYGLSASQMISSGTILTLEKNKAHVTVNGDFEAVRFGKSWVYASAFPGDISRHADQWVKFRQGSVVDLHKTTFRVLKGSITDRRASSPPARTLNSYSRPPTAPQFNPDYLKPRRDEATYAYDYDEEDIEVVMVDEEELEAYLAEEEINTAPPTGSNGKRTARKPRAASKGINYSQMVHRRGWKE